MFCDAGWLRKAPSGVEGMGSVTPKTARFLLYINLVFYAMHLVNKFYFSSKAWSALWSHERDSTEKVILLVVKPSVVA